MARVRNNTQAERTQVLSGLICAPLKLSERAALSQALRNLRALRIAALFAAAVAAAAALACAVFPRAAGVPAGAAPLWLAAAAAMCGAAAVAAHQLIPHLVHHPWDHTLRA